MKRILVTLSVLTVVAISGFTTLAVMPTQQGENNSGMQAVAEEKTATFNVENMTCAMCPITVRKAMKEVSGVKSVVVDYDTKIATVAFNPELTTLEKIGDASTNAGYPASLVREMLDES